MRAELLLIVVAACGSSAPAPAPVANAAPERIVVGAVLPMTGAMAPFGMSLEAGLRVGITGDGVPIELVVMDSAASPTGAADAARALIDEHQPVAVIGELTSAPTRAMYEAIAASGVPVLAPAATDPELTELGPTLFPIAAADPTQGVAAARWAYDQGLRRAAILNDSTPYADRIADAFASSFEAMGGAIVAREPYQTGDTSFLGQLGVIELTQPDVLFAPGYYVDAAVLAQQARDRGLTMPLLGSDGWASAELLDVPALAGARYVEHFAVDDPSDAARAFVTAWSAVHAEPPDSIAALGHDTIIVLRDAIARAGSTEPDALVPALRVTNLALATGGLSYIASGRAMRDMAIVRVEPGRATFEARAPAR